MLAFQDWLKKEYRRWCRRARTGKEDFLGFCYFLGYAPELVLAWMNEDAVPQGGQVLNLGGLLNRSVFMVLGLPEPVEEVWKAYASLSHLESDLRSRAADALWGADAEIRRRDLDPAGQEAREVLARVFEQNGFLVQHLEGKNPETK